MKRLTSTQVLAFGFTIILGLLVYSASEAFRLQRAGGEQQDLAYQRFIREDNAISILRRTVFLGGIYTRDYFLDRTPGGRERYGARVAELERNGAESLELLRAAGMERKKDTETHAAFAGFFQELYGIGSADPASLSAPSDLIDEVLIPRRRGILALLEDVRGAARQELAVAQARFHSDRAAAARRLLFLLGAAIVIGVLVALLSLRYAGRLDRERQRHLETVSLANLELENLSNRLLEIQEQERRTLAQELHDEVGQTLTALRMELSHAISLAREPSSHERLVRARALAEKTVDTVRNISLMLRPSLLDDLGLGPALQWQLEQFGDRSGIAFTLEGGELGEQLPEAVKTCVFRIAQEALNNCEKYAGAASVRVILRHDSTRVSLEVQDNGAGFTLDRRGLPSRGSGILGMKERAQKLGGTLTVESLPGDGTRIALILPADPPAPAAAGPFALRENPR